MTDCCNYGSKLQLWLLDIQLRGPLMAVFVSKQAQALRSDGC